MNDGATIRFQGQQIGLLQTSLVKADFLPIQFHQIREMREEGVEALGKVKPTRVVLQLPAFVRAFGVSLAPEGVQDGVQQLERVRVFDGDGGIVNGGHVAGLRVAGDKLVVDPLDAGVFHSFAVEGRVVSFTGGTGSERLTADKLRVDGGEAVAAVAGGRAVGEERLMRRVAAATVVIAAMRGENDVARGGGGFVRSLLEIVVKIVRLALSTNFGLFREELRRIGSASFTTRLLSVGAQRNERLANQSPVGFAFFADEGRCAGIERDFDVRGAGKKSLTPVFVAEPLVASPESAAAAVRRSNQNEYLQIAASQRANLQRRL